MIRLADDGTVLYCTTCGEGWPSVTPDPANIRTLEREHGECDEDDEPLPRIGSCPADDIRLSLGSPTLYRRCMKAYGHTGSHHFGDWRAY